MYKGISRFILYRWDLISVHESNPTHNVLITTEADVRFCDVYLDLKGIDVSLLPADDSHEISSLIRFLRKLTTF